MYDEALVLNREVLRINPDQHLAHHYLGIIWKNQDGIEQSIFHFSEALRLNPDDAEVKKRLAQVLESRDRINTPIILSK